MGNINPKKQKYVLIDISSVNIFLYKINYYEREVFYSNNTNFGLVGSFIQGGSGSSFEKILLQQLYYSGLRNSHCK